MTNIFKKFEDAPASDMEAWIKAQYEQAPAALLSYMKFSLGMSAKRIELAVAAYRDQIERFAEYLDSRDPDHYKRCGALLYALCANPIITDVDAEFTADQVESGFSRVPHADSEHLSRMLSFYENFHNQFVAFGICLSLCEVYEGRTKELTFNDIQLICFYLQRNNLPIDAYFMLFKTLML